MNALTAVIKQALRDPRSKPRVDLTGKRFGTLVAKSYSGRKQWRVACDCGVVKDTNGTALRAGRTKTCGGQAHPKKGGLKNLIDMTGKKFGKLTVKKYMGSSKWLCVCSCGRDRVVIGKFLRSGEVDACKGHGGNLEVIAGMREKLAECDLHKTEMFDRKMERSIKGLVNRINAGVGQAISEMRGRKYRTVNYRDTVYVLRVA